MGKDERGASPIKPASIIQSANATEPQIHLDVTVQDVDAAEQAAVDGGATRLDGARPNWRVYADPAGKPFCLVWTV
jgi:hypothetical protein